MNMRNYSISFLLLSLVFSIGVLANTDDIDITADHLEMELSTQALELRDNVDVRYLDIRVQAPSAFYRYTQKELWMGPDVDVAYQDLTFRSDTLQVYQTKGELLGSGNVVVTFNPYTGFAQKVRYLKEKNVIILTGNPRFVNQDETLQAEELILNTQTRRITSKGRTQFSSSKKAKEN